MIHSILLETRQSRFWTKVTTTKLSELVTACDESSRDWRAYLEVSIEHFRVEIRPAFVAHGVKMTKK